MTEDITLQDRGYYLLFDDITPSSAQSLVQWIIEQNFSNKAKRLTIIINSPGGDVWSWFAIVDAIKTSNIPVDTIWLWSIASAWLIIFLAGKNRTITPRTSIMSHQFSAISIWKEHELIAYGKENQLTSERIMEHYRECTKLPKTKIKKYLLPESDAWLSAQEAKELKVCTNIAFIDYKKQNTKKQTKRTGKTK